MGGRVIPAIRNLVETSDPAEEPVTLDEAKAHLNVTIAADDALIEAQISAAREWAEKETRRAFVARDFAVSYDGFYPAKPRRCLNPEREIRAVWGTIALPRPPLIAVSAITYLDFDGQPVVLPPDRYRVTAGGKKVGSVTPAYGLSWPSGRVDTGAVVISYRAGYGTRQDVPQAIKAAILLLVGNLYRFREPCTDVALVPIPFGVKALLSAHRWN